MTEPGPPSGQPEQRVHSRREADIQVRVAAPGGVETILLSRDWSRHALFLRTVSPYPEGTRVTMSALLGQPLRRVYLAGVVVRSDVQREPAARGPCGMAIELDPVPERIGKLLDGV